MKYLLSTGELTSKIENYILDLFKLNLYIYPNDIPNSNIGFNFILGDVKKNELVSEIRTRISQLVEKLSNRFSGIRITLDSVELLSEDIARVTVTVNQETDKIELVI